MDERVYKWYQTYYGIDKDTYDKHLRIAERVRSGESLLKACRAVGYECVEINKRWGRCIEEYLRNFPQHLIGDSREGWWSWVPTVYIDAITWCSERHDGQGWLKWLILGLFGIGIIMVISTERK